MGHSKTNPLVALHDSRGRIVFAQPLVEMSAAEVLFSQPWDWVQTSAEKDVLKTAFQQVLFDREPMVIRARFRFHDNSTLYECRGVPVETNDVTVMATSIPIEEDEPCLTLREVECLREIISGKHTADIAREMGVKATTISTYKQRIKEKLDVDSLAGLIAWGCKHLQ